MKKRNGKDQKKNGNNCDGGLYIVCAANCVSLICLVLLH